MQTITEKRYQLDEDEEAAIILRRDGTIKIIATGAMTIDGWLRIKNAAAQQFEVYDDGT